MMPIEASKTLIERRRRERKTPGGVTNDLKRLERL